MRTQLRSGKFTITLEKTGRATGTIFTKEGSARAKATKLYNIFETPVGITCKVDLGFFDPTVQLVVEPDAVRVDAPGQAYDKRYPASPADIQRLRQFIVACRFPKG